MFAAGVFPESDSKSHIPIPVAFNAAGQSVLRPLRECEEIAAITGASMQWMCCPGLEVAKESCDMSLFAGRGAVMGEAEVDADPLTGSRFQLLQKPITSKQIRAGFVSPVLQMTIDRWAGSFRARPDRHMSADDSLCGYSGFQTRPNLEEVNGSSHKD